jgi:hypothetical protein
MTVEEIEAKHIECTKDGLVVKFDTPHELAPVVAALFTEVRMLQHVNHALKAEMVKLVLADANEGTSA